jgi:hypothetical protein
VLLGDRSRQIASRMGIGPAHQAPQCLSCHATFVPAAQRGPKYDIEDGVGCESCHGASGGWLASHYALDATHADNVARGLLALEKPMVRADNCLDCHFGDAGDRFVNHRMMAAGHPRVSFELELFTALQKHHDEDADYAKRKAVAGGVRFWAVGQAMAVDRAVSLYARADRGTEGAWPEFTFFDCRSCHRDFSDDAAYRATKLANPRRPIPVGMPPFADENMIMLSAAAKVAAPDLAARFEADSRAFHAGLARDRGEAVRRAQTLAATSRLLAGRFNTQSFSKQQTLAMLRTILDEASAYTDYQGGAQAVMATDSLLAALVADGSLSRGAVAGLKPDIDAAYRATRDANAWKPADFRAAIARIETGVRRL